MKQSKKSLFGKMFLVLMVAALLLSSLTLLPVGAQNYFLTDDELYAQYMPQAYDVSDVLISIDGQNIKLTEPQDLFVDQKDNVYIVDRGNNRVVMLDKNLHFVRTFPDKKASPKARLDTPNGVYVDGDGDLFIADTENGRVVHLSKDGQFVEDFKQPTEETYDTEYEFKPTKVYVDEYGIIYVINGEDHHGVLTLNAKGQFLGYIGTIKVKYSLVQSIVRMFGSKDQQAMVGQESPPCYSNMSINGDGTIYATSAREEKNQIKRLTPAGDNVYEEKEFAEENKKVEYEFLPSLVDLAVDKEGIVYAADEAVNAIYIYDQNGNNIATFGGTGQTKMTFGQVSSIAINSKNEILVLDEELNTIQRMVPTDFMANILRATNLYNKGEYEQALEPWQKVLSMDPAYKLAQVGVAKSLLRDGKNSEALALYEQALDAPGYSEAFEEIRMDIFRANFGWIVLIILVALAALIFVVSRLRRFANAVAERGAPENDRFGAKFFIETVVCVIFHPMDAFYRIKYNRKALRVWPVLLMLAILVVEKIAFRSIIHFPLTDSAVWVDYARDLVIFFLPIVSWIVVAYAISSIQDGKQTFIETATSTLYSFIPFMILYLPVTWSSQLMGTSESGLYHGMQAILLIWSLILIYLNFKILNEYSFGKTIGTIFMIIFAMVALWIIIFLFFIIVSQLFDFIGDLYKEIIYMFK